MARYLVTGAAGFIGARVAELLLDEANQVIGADNLNDAYDIRLKQWRLSRLTSRPEFTFEKLDICERAAVEALWDRHGPFEAILNLAARAGVRYSVENPWIYMDVNVTGALNLLELCRIHKIPKFVLASTSSLYGAHNRIPYREDDDTSQPLSPYAASKKAAESLCHTYHHLHGLDITVLRYFTVYGPAGRPDMSPFRFVQWISEGRPVVIYGDGSQSRDFTYVDDIARGTVAALRPAGYLVVNLGSDQPVVLKDAIQIIERRMGRRATLVFRPAHPADVPATWANIDRARQCLGWSAATGFEDGIDKLASWYEDHRSWTSQIRTAERERSDR